MLRFPICTPSSTLRFPPSHDMTVQSSETHTNGFHHFASPLPKPNGINGVSVLKAAHRERPVPSNMLGKFIQQYRELESHKYGW